MALVRESRLYMQNLLVIFYHLPAYSTKQSGKKVEISNANRLSWDKIFNGERLMMKGIEHILWFFFFSFGYARSMWKFPDQRTHTTAATQAASVTMPDPQPTAAQENSSSVTLIDWNWWFSILSLVWKLLPTRNVSQPFLTEERWCYSQEFLLKRELHWGR